MKTLLNQLSRWFDILLNAMASISGGILLFMMLLVCYDVVMRYLFRNPTGWAIEVCEYLLVYLTFLGSPWLLREKGHVNVDILTLFFPKNVIRKFNIFTSLIVTISTCILAVFCAGATWDFYQRGIIMFKMLTVPKWTLLWVIPFGCFCLCIESLRQFLSNLAQLGTDSNLKHQSTEAEI